MVVQWITDAYHRLGRLVTFVGGHGQEKQLNTGDQVQGSSEGKMGIQNCGIKRWMVGSTFEQPLVSNILHWHGFLYNDTHKIKNQTHKISYEILLYKLSD